MSTASHTARAKDAVALLTADHSKVKQLFTEYEKQQNIGDISLKADLALHICLELTIHTTIEEEIFYPAVRRETGDQHLVEEAIQEHAEAKELIARIQGMAGDDPDLDGTVAILRRAIEHHVQEEESQMFPKARASDADLTALCEQLQERKEQLEHDMSAAPLRAGTREARGERSAIGQADS
ncbi:hemerythrin domain-containing protein [Massilia endophytica]|jgi:iron-sulfur cluster repair protein YtfE (RIC family)|uniref:hemerythrin domain-containing protein n=1 Tax=Massilia endophytica TaxID=2899220 RepID=UPI001E56A296|nr:hemerythrin domain-containing protein [Massilia endophytica]UGQ47896.1 hemerythrin domain-containing protein [Massilia endophytica]